MRNLSVWKIYMPGKHFIRMRNRGSRDETWDDAHFKSSRSPKILCGHRIRKAMRIILIYLSPLKYLFEKDKKYRSSFRTFMNMQSWSTLHGFTG